jgi:hypothetical protein
MLGVIQAALRLDLSSSSASGVGSSRLAALKRPAPTITKNTKAIAAQTITSNITPYFGMYEVPLPAGIPLARRIAHVT